MTPDVRTVLVLAGGEPADPAVRALLPDASVVIAADSGLHQARALDLHVDVVVGDLDSVDPSVLDEAVRAGARVERHPREKDATDLELALDAARAAGAQRTVVLGIGGGRLDHFLANALVLASPRFASMRVEAVVGDGRVVVVHDAATLDALPGDLVTLLPVGGPAHGVRTRGLRYPLHGETLDASSTRGVSNEVVAVPVEVALDAGTLLVVSPGSSVAPVSRPAVAVEGRA